MQVPLHVQGQGVSQAFDLTFSANMILGHHEQLTNMGQEHNICIWDENDTPWCPTTDDTCGKGLYKEAGGDDTVQRWDEVSTWLHALILYGSRAFLVSCDSRFTRKTLQCIGLPEAGGGSEARESDFIPPSFVPKKAGQRAVGILVV